MLGTERLEAYYSSNYKNHAWQKSYSQSEKHATFKQGQIEGKLTVNSKETIVELITGQVVPDFVKQLEEAGQENLITRYLQEQHHREEKSIAGPSAAFSALIGIAITALTAGTQAGSSMSVMLGLGKGAAAVGACSAAIGCIGSRLADGLLRNNGDLGKALKGLTKPDFIKQFVISVASAGISGGICDKFNIKAPTALEMKSMSPIQVFAAQLDYNLTKGLISASVNTVVGNQKPGKALLEGIKGAAIAAAGATAAGQVGLARHDGGMQNVEAYIVHSGIGAMIGLASTGELEGAASGAIGAFVSEVTADLIKEKPSVTAAKALRTARERGIAPTKENLAGLIQEDLCGRASAAKFSGAFAAFLAKQNPDLAYMAADNAVSNNFENSSILDALKAYADDVAGAVDQAHSENPDKVQEILETAALLDEAEDILDVVAQAEAEVLSLADEAREASKTNALKAKVDDQGPTPTLTYDEVMGNQPETLDAALQEAQLAAIEQKIATLEGMGVSDHLAALKDVALEGLRDAAHEIRTKPFKTAGKVVGGALYEAGDFITPGGLDPAADCIQGRKTFGEAAAWQAAGAGVELGTLYLGKVVKVGRKGVGILAGITKKVIARAGEKAAQKPLQKGLTELAKQKSSKSPLKEGQVGTYRELKRMETPGDNLTPNHMPQAAYMEKKGVHKNDGIAMMMDHPHPGTGGRHRSTRTYGRQPDLNVGPRKELARDIADARRIYQQDGAYTPDIRQGLQDVVKQNKETFPELFKKLGINQ